MLGDFWCLLHAIPSGLGSGLDRGDDASLRQLTPIKHVEVLLLVSPVSRVARPRFGRIVGQLGTSRIGDALAESEHLAGLEQRQPGE